VTNVDCPSDTYADTSTLICEKCNVTCLTCDGNSDSNCLTCYSSPEQRYLLNKKCLLSCPDDLYYANGNNNKCEDCPVNCKRCIGPNSNQCTSCLIDYFLTFYDTCETGCDEGYRDFDNQICKRNYKKYQINYFNNKIRLLYKMLLMQQRDNQ
jgi:proprotein convertase subtilisin/kexin type 5